MPLPITGQISFQQIRNEFKSPTGQVSFQEMYRGGSFVSSDVFCHNNTIPASGQINASGFRNTTNGNTVVLNQSTPIPANAQRAQLWVVGAGGGGARLNNPGPQAYIDYRSAAGGGGGGYARWSISGLAGQVSSITVTRGAAGAGSYQQINTAAAGGDGTASSAAFVGSGVTFSVAGGEGGYAGGSGVPAGGQGVYGNGTGGPGGVATNALDSGTSGLLTYTRVEVGNGGTGAQKDNADTQVAGGVAGWNAFTGTLATGGVGGIGGQGVQPGEAGSVRIRF